MKIGIFARAGQIANTPSFIEITSEYNADRSELLCAGISTTQTVYTATSSTIADAFLNDEALYTDSALTTLATTGFYTDTIGTTNYGWSSSTGWVVKITC
jgi:hypothetical protein